MRLGATAVPLNVRETTDTLCLQASRANLLTLVCERETESTTLEIASELALSCWSVDDPTADTIEWLEGAAAETVIDEPDTREVDPATLEDDDEVIVMFTSGTSGEPKGVRLTIGNLLASATASAFRLGLERGDRWLCCLPTYHMGGLAPVIRSTLYGTTAVVQRRFDAERTAACLDRYDITGVSLVPTMCTRLLEAGWRPPETLRFVLLGGAAASSELLERCFDRGVAVYPTYGMTETASQIATATPEQAQQHDGTVGQPLAFVDVTILGTDGTPVERGEFGDLVVSGPMVTPGYLEDRHTEAAFVDGGLRTGDTARQDEAGRLWIGGRRDDRIVTGGENVDPEAVAEILRDHPDVDDAAVVGLDDPEWGERVGALVVSARPLEVDSLRSHWEGRLADFKRPKTVAMADELPRTASGTVDREAVRDRLNRAGTDP